jgi:ribonuclease Y
MESLIIPIITGILAALAGLGLGKIIFAKDTAAKVADARKQAEQILSDAAYKAENLKKEKLLEAKEKFVQLKSDNDRESLERNRKQD